MKNSVPLATVEVVSRWPGSLVVLEGHLSVAVG